MQQYSAVFAGIMIPLLGTSVGAAAVFFMKEEMNPLVQKFLLGFASGVMVAASVWSLLIPAMEMSEDMGRLAFLPAAGGVAAGMAFLLLIDHSVPHLHLDSDEPEGPRKSLSKTTMMIFAVTMHNLPEGMAVGVVFAGAMGKTEGITMASAAALALGIAIQNFPEGAIISMPLASTGIGKTKAFIYGVLSGVVEPLGALLTIAFTQILLPFLPTVLAFAAGAMLYVVVEELIPESAEGPHSNLGTVGFGVGFIAMMILDVALG